MKEQNFIVPQQFQAVEEDAQGEWWTKCSNPWPLGQVR
jgi:hypothetical protein